MNDDVIRYRTYRVNTAVAEHSAMRAAVAEGLEVSFAFTEEYIPEFHGKWENLLEV